MSCVLRISTSALDERLSQVAIKPYRVENGTAHFDVSGCGFEDFPGQVKDAIEFLHSHARDLRLLLSFPESEGVMDFAIESRRDGYQFRAFPPSLVREAAAIGLGLEQSYYPQEGSHAGA